MKVVIASQNIQEETRQINSIHQVVEERDNSSNELKHHTEVQVDPSAGVNKTKHKVLVPTIGWLEVESKKSEQDGFAFETSMRLNEGLRISVLAKDNSDAKVIKIEDVVITVDGDGTIHYPTTDATPGE